MTVEGRGQFEKDINAGGAALQGAAGKGDALSKSLGGASAGSLTLGASVGAAGRELLAMGDRGLAAMRTIGTGMTIAGIAIAAVVGLSVAKYAEYDAALSKSIAVTGAYGEELDAIRKLTISLGGETVYTAKEAADGVAELGRAGVSTADILGGALAGSLNLAAAGEIGVADAAAITATALNLFKLKGSEAGHVSDLLAAAAGKAQGGVAELSQGLKQSGLVASQMGLSVEETTGTLAAFASAGLIGSDAGTSFRTMLLNLATPTSQQRDLMAEFNIQAYDAQGNFVGLTSLAGQLKAGFADSTQAQRDYALGIMFGSDAIRAANVLYNEGTEGIQGWIGAVDEAGYAAKIAGINQNNLQGDLEKLGGAFDSALINTGAGANGVLRDLIQSTTELVDGFAELPSWMQQVVLGGAALTAGLLITGGAFTVGITKAIEFRAAMAILRTDMPATAAALGKVGTFLAGPWGIAIAAAVLGVNLLSKYLDSLQSTTTEITNSLTTAKTAAEIFTVALQGKDTKYWADTSDALKNLDKDLQLAGEEADNVWARFNNDTAQNATIDGLRDIGKQLGELSTSDLPAAQRAFRLIAEETDMTDERLGQLLDTMPEYRDALIEQATAQGINVTTGNELVDAQRMIKLSMGDAEEATTSAADAYVVASDEVGALQDSLDSLLDTLNEANGANQDAITTNIAYKDTLAEIDLAVQNAKDKVDGYTNTLDTNSEAGRTNMGMLVQLADDAWTAAEAQLAVDGNTQNFQASLEASRDALIKRAQDFGLNADEAANLADKILKIPSKAETEAIVNTVGAKNAISDLQGRLATFIRSRYVVDVGGNVRGLTEHAYGGIDYVRHMADGGIMSNAGQQAQIRRAGDLTVWAEQETGGEAYVPFALDRRARSESIMQTVAGIFGGTYIPAGARTMAVGGIDGGGSTGTGKTINLGGIHMHNPVSKDPVEDARTAAQYAEAVLNV